MTVRHSRRTTPFAIPAAMRLETVRGITVETLTTGYYADDAAGDQP